MPDFQVSDQLLTGRDESMLVVTGGGHRLQAEAAAAFEALQSDAAAAGFELLIASSYRSFERQCLIWNGKARGERTVHDDAGTTLLLADMTRQQQMQAILRFSALPGTSRHHWGTDIDVYDAAAMPPGYNVQLTPAEVAAGGMFDDLHCWLDQRMAAGESRGFYRPYATDTGGVSPERWHLSYAPLASLCEPGPTAAALRVAWDSVDKSGEGLALRDAVDAE
ncbi:MAG: M15 family metallopeptidase, partial [Halieaceae bacterium]